MHRPQSLGGTDDAQGAPADVQSMPRSPSTALLPSTPRSSVARKSRPLGGHREPPAVPRAAPDPPVCEQFGSRNAKFCRANKMMSRAGLPRRRSSARRTPASSVTAVSATRSVHSRRPICDGSNPVAGVGSAPAIRWQMRHQRVEVALRQWWRHERPRIRHHHLLRCSSGKAFVP